MPKRQGFSTLKRENQFKNPPKDWFGVPTLQEICLPHIESFNSLTELRGSEKGLLKLAIEDIEPRSVFDYKTGSGLGNKLTMWVADITIAKPMNSQLDRHSIVRQLFPSECRERFHTYAAKIYAKLCYKINDGPVMSIDQDIGNCPIMVKSNRCHLAGMYPEELIKHHEESEEMGGYFIVNGIEKIIRLLIVPRRNHVIAIVRPSFANRGPRYSQFGTAIRCARPDQTTVTNTVHYLTDGNCMLRFSWMKQEYIVPVVLVLKALMETSDIIIFQKLCRGDTKNTFFNDRIELMLRAFKNYLAIYTRIQCLAYLGSKFRVVLGLDEDLTDAGVGTILLKKVLFVHLKEDRDKFELLIYMVQKLYSLVLGECCADNPDSPQHQEILLGGHLYGAIIKEKIDEWLAMLQGEVRKTVKNQEASTDFYQKNFLNKTITKVNFDLGKKLRYFLATGNLTTRTGLDLQQVQGYTIVAEKINFYRYISHFRCVHRGSFFAELKTTTVRKLLPEAWGFLCPVHTPDGAPCGLLNHLSHTCKIVNEVFDVSAIPSLLASFGLGNILTQGTHSSQAVVVQLDGRIIGWCLPAQAVLMANALRLFKTEGSHRIPLDLEIGLVPPSHGGQYPGLFLFSSPARMMRPTHYLTNRKRDMVGSFEQIYMDIACTDDDVIPGITTHQDIAPTSMLSIVANLTPFSDFNQSPRNMYQCQMAKQTMGTPASALVHRTDNKLYRLQTGQTPIVRPELHNHYGMDHFPNGTNAIVCVISYTGYDMEDAMIINKSSHERGFGYGTVYKSEVIDLEEMRRAGEPIAHHFGLGPDANKKWRDKIDVDGLPFIGVTLSDGDPLCAYIDDLTGRTHVKKYRGTEDAIVDEVRLLGSEKGSTELQKIHIKFRITRPPIIGDKFSSRHGQKGVCSQKWPAVDMPFTESGMQPDVIINPHAFPSRMTIGMFVESLAGKAGALHGIPQDATPFKFNEQYTAADYFGEQLLKAGYNFHGNEPMYSGTTGEEMRVDIYIGVVYYQRLRHMVSDKFQVRTTGPVHNLTMQPVKGRKRAGGIRFGEMERDSLLAHGTSFLLQDRLMNCSDYSQSYVCRKCGSIVSIVSAITPSSLTTRREIECKNCQSSRYIELVALPYVFRYLATELMCMGIKLNLEVKP